MYKGSYVFTSLPGFTFQQYYFAKNGGMEGEEGSTLIPV